MGRPRWEGGRAFDELAGAISRDDLQDVGRRAREILIDCAKLLADPSLIPREAAEGRMRRHGSNCSSPRRIREPSRRAAPVHPRGLGVGPDGDPRDIERVEAFAAAQATS